MVKIESIFQQVLLSLRWQHMIQNNHDDDMSAIFFLVYHWIKKCITCFWSYHFRKIKSKIFSRFVMVPFGPVH